MKKIALIVLVTLFGFHLSNAQTSEVQEDRIYSFVTLKDPPRFPGGIAKFYRFLVDNLKYPEAARAKKIQGTVFVSFIVEKDGSLSNIKTVRGLSTETDQEAERMLKISPKWEPGSLNGRPIRTQYNIPIKFALK